jgi:hypothetical protein
VPKARNKTSFNFKIDGRRNLFFKGRLEEHASVPNKALYNRKKSLGSFFFIKKRGRRQPKPQSF